MDRSFEDYKKIIDEHLLDFIPNIDNKSITLYEAMKYSLAAGGKRLRPVLLLAACERGNSLCMCYGIYSHIFPDS